MLSTVKFLLKSCKEKKLSSSFFTLLHLNFLLNNGMYLLKFFKKNLRRRKRSYRRYVFYKKPRLSRKRFKIKIFSKKKLWFEWITENLLYKKFNITSHVRITNSGIFFRKRNFFKTATSLSYSYKKIWRTRHKKLLLSLLNFRFYYNPGLLVLDMISEFKINRRH
jgi:hypothetical protein